MSDWSDNVPGSMTSNTGGLSSGSGFNAGLPVGLALLGAITSYNGYQSAAAATVSAGRSQAAMYQFKAAQDKINATQAMAAATMNAAEIGRQGQLALSHNMALVAAGGTAGSPTAIRVMAKQAGATSYQQSLALYQGEDTARSLTIQAESDMMSGEMAEQNAQYQSEALQTKGESAAVSAGAGLFAKYGASFFAA